jgi:hypothetical protein
MDPTPTANDLLQLLQGAGTPMAGVIVFLLYRLNKEVGDLKVEIKTFTEVMTKYFPKGKE